MTTQTNPEPARHEIVEEAATNWFLSTGYRPNDDYISYKEGFKKGAQWQQFQLQAKLERYEKALKEITTMIYLLQTEALKEETR